MVGENGAGSGHITLQLEKMPSSCTDSNGGFEPYSSDDEELPQTAAAFAAQLRRHKKRAARFQEVGQEVVSLKSQVDQRARKQDELRAHMEQHMKDVLRNDNQLKNRVEALDSENSDLKQRSLEFSAEHERIEERLQEGKTQLSDTENRIQRLMDRLVTLLSNGSTTDAVRIQFSQELEESVLQYERRLESQQNQLMEARKENRKGALQLSDEQRRTKRLHDHLCKKQSLLFNRQRHQPEIQAYNGMDGFDRHRDQTSASSSASIGQADVDRKVASTSGEDDRGSLAPQDPVLNYANCSGQLLPTPSAPETGAGPNVEDTRPASQLLDGLTEDKVPQTTSGVSPPLPGAQTSGCDGWQGQPNAQTNTVSPPSRERIKEMETRLCDVLDAMQFENLVVRLGNGLYQFGRSWRAHVRLGDNQEVFASVDDCEYEPIKDFITRISRQERSLEGSAMSSVVPNSMPVSGASARGGMTMQETDLVTGPSEDHSGGVDREQLEASRAQSLRMDAQERAVSVPTDPASVAGAASRQMCAQMLDPTWTSLPRSARSPFHTEREGDRRERPPAERMHSQNSLQGSLLVQAASFVQGFGGPSGSLRARASSPTTQQASASSTARVRSPGKVHAGDDAAGHSVFLLGDAPIKEPPRSPPPGSRIPYRSISTGNNPGIASADIAGGFVARPRLDKRSSVPLGTGGAQSVLRRSPPRRAASPDEGNRSRASLGQSASGGAGSATSSANGGSGPLTMTTAGSNYGSGHFGSSNYGSGSYVSGSFTSATPKAKSPCRAAVVGVAPARASPPRTMTPRAAQLKQPLAQSAAQHRVVPCGGLSSGGSGSGLPVTSLGGPGMSNLQELPLSVGGSLTVASGGSLTSTAALSSWPSPPRTASPVGLGHGHACNTKTWHHLLPSATPPVAIDNMSRVASVNRTTSTSPARATAPLSSGSGGLVWR